MSRALKVYAVNHCGIHRRIVAATSQVEAARLMGVTIGHIRGYGSVTGNDKELSLALPSPGVVFQQSTDVPYGQRDWARVTP